MTEVRTGGGEVLGEFSRDGLVFTVRSVPRDVFEVDAREGDAPPALISRIYPFSPSEWFSAWHRDSWRPWIDQQARQLIKTKQAKAVQ